MVNVTLLVKNMTASTDANLSLKASFSGMTSLNYDLAVAGFNNTNVGVGSVSYVLNTPRAGPLDAMASVSAKVMIESRMLLLKHPSCKLYWPSFLVATYPLMHAGMIHVFSFLASTTQVQEAVSQAVLSKVNSIISKTIQDVLNANVDKLKYSGNYNILG